MIIDKKNLEQMIHLVCEWNDAMARDNRAEKEMQELNYADDEMSLTLAQAICVVEKCTEKALHEFDKNATDIADWNPNHPKQQLERIRWLKDAFDCNDMPLILDL